MRHLALIQTIRAYADGESEAPEDEPAYGEKLIGEGLASLGELDISEVARQERKELLLFLAGKIHWLEGRADLAIQRLQESIELGEGRGEIPGQQYLTLIQILKQVGQWSEARELALRCRERFAGEDNIEGEMVVLGELAQISRRLEDFTDAVYYANLGFNLAKELGETREQAIFKGDLAQINLAADEIEPAIILANESLELAHEFGDELHELKALGVLGQCYFKQGDIERARENADRGLELARSLPSRTEEAAFLYDLGRIQALQGEKQNTLEYFKQASVIYAEQGVLESLALLQGESLGIAAELGEWQFFFSSLANQILVCDELDSKLQTGIMATLPDRLKEALTLFKLEETRQGLGYVWQRTSKYVQEFNEDVSDQVRFLTDLVAVFLSLVLGRPAEATQIAEQLDQLTNNSLRLVEYVSQNASLYPEMPAD